MKIQSIVIENFRSIKRAEFNPSAFNTLVGQNNHGKTNVFEAIRWFYTGKGDISDLRYSEAGGDAEFFVETTFSEVQEGLEQISNDDNKKKLKNVLGDLNVMRIRRSSLKPKDREIYNPAKGDWQKQPTGADSAFNNCIPRFEFIEATKNLKDVSTFKTNTPIGQMLGGVLTQVLEKDATYREFRNTFEKLFASEDSKIRKTLNALSEQVQKYIEKQFPDCSSVRFSVEEPSFDDLLKSFSVRLNDGVDTSAEDKGDGMQRALMLAIIKTHADHRREDALGRSFIFFIDEAELHLHSTAQRQLKDALLELSAGVDQVFINTHSSVLITDDTTNQAVFKVAKDDGATSVTPVTHLDKQSIVYDLLGGSPADLLLPPNFLIVEGPSEEILISNIITRFYADRPEIQIVKAEGDDERQRQNMEAINLVYKPLSYRPIYRDKVVILCDKPEGNKQARFDEFMKHNDHLKHGQQVHVLPVEKLEEYYPEQWRPVNGINSKGKKKLAKQVSEEISQEVFEADMQVIYSAMKACWDRAFNDQQTTHPKDK